MSRATRDWLAGRRLSPNQDSSPDFQPKTERIARVANFALPIWAEVFEAFARGELVIYPKDFAGQIGKNAGAVYAVLAEMAQAGFLQESPSASATAYTPGPRINALIAGCLSASAYAAQGIAAELERLRAVVAALQCGIGAPAASTGAPA